MSHQGFAQRQQHSAPLRLADLLQGREETLLRPLKALIARELQRQRGKAVSLAESAFWDGSTAVDEDGLGVDSLARLDLVAAVNRMFQLHRTGVEDYLLVNRTLAGWCEVIVEGFRALPSDEPERVAFETSGSTGVPKTVEHDVAEMIEEVTTHLDLFPGAARVVSMVPSHHVYGFLFGVLSPLTNRWPVVDLTTRGPGALFREYATGDVVIGTPLTWALVLKSGGYLNGDATGVTSTSPAPPELWHQLKSIGLKRLVEIYGSTETMGIGVRECHDAPFKVMAHLEPDKCQHAFQAVARKSRRPIIPQDRIERDGPDLFRVLGRKDEAVQVGGVNVFPSRVEWVLSKAPGVAEVAVRLDGTDGTARLKAFIVPSNPQILENADKLEASVRQFAHDSLSDPERPASLCTGPILPRNELGKLMDW